MVMFPDTWSAAPALTEVPVAVLPKAFACEAVRMPAEEHWPKLAETLQTTFEELAARDVKAPIQDARRLVARSPDYAVVFRRIVEKSKHLSAAEILREMDSGEKKKDHP